MFFHSFPANSPNLPGLNKLGLSTSARRLRVALGVSALIHGLVLLPLAFSEPGVSVRSASLLTGTLVAVHNAGQFANGQQVQSANKVQAGSVDHGPANHLDQQNILSEPALNNALHAAQTVRLASGAPASRDEPLPQHESGVPSETLGASIAQTKTARGEASGEVRSEVSGEDALGGYRQALSDHARKHPAYPLLARERGWQGRAQVRVRVSHTGQASSVELSATSGYGLLDREAVALLVRTAAQVPVPTELVGRDFSVVLPVAFDLRR